MNTSKTPYINGISQMLDRLSSLSLLAGVCLGAMLALVPAWLNYDIIARDGAHLYVPVATLLLEGRVHEALYGPYHPLFPLPLYEVLIFAVAKFSGLAPETSGRLVSAVSFVLGAIGMYKVAELLLKNRTAALMSVLLYISNKQLLENSVDCLKESLLVCIIIWGNYCILEGIARSPRKTFYFGAGGLLFLGGAMVRSTSIVFGGAWIIVWMFHQRAGLFQRAMIFLFPAVAFVVMSYLKPEFPLFRRSFSLNALMSLSSAYQNPWQVVHAMGVWVLQFLRLAQYGMLVFGVLGFYHLRRMSYTRHYFIVLAGFFLLCIGIGWNYSNEASDRYILAPVLWLIPAAGDGIMRSLNSGRWAMKALALLTVVAAPFFWAHQVFDPPDADYLARKEAGLWILAQTGARQDVISNRERISFYAQGNIINLVDVPELEYMGAAVAQRYPENSWLRLSDILKGHRLTKVVAIDTLLEDGRAWKKLLDRLAIRPDHTFRTLIIYLPQPVHLQDHSFPD